MFKIPLGPDDTFLLLAPRAGHLDPAWQIVVLALALFVPLGLIGWLYRFELRLVSGWQACGLFALRIAIVLVLWLAIGLQPHVAEIHVDETPGRVRVAVDLSASMDVTDPGQSRSRREILHDILSADGKNLLQRLTERHDVEIIGFDEAAIDLQPAQLLDRLARPNGNAASTNLHAALDKTQSRRDQPLLGVLLFSDGGHNVGPSPIARAEALRKERIPVFPVVVGAKEPPSDLMILDVQAPTKIFKGATAPIAVRAKVANLPPQELTVEMRIDGQPAKPEHTQVIKHDGKDTVADVRFQAKLDDAGTRLIEIKATSKAGKEITLVNNSASHAIRVAEEKIKVLLIDGDARWEYHYLAAALVRDPAVALERVVFAQPRIGAIKDAELEKAGLPKTKLPEITKERDPLRDYDCIVLGDVAPEDVPIAERRRLEKYVSERGGTLVMIAGKRYLPMAYANTGAIPDEPFVKLLPITEPRELKKDDGFNLKPTMEGKQRPFLQMEPDKAVYSWPELPKHFWGVVGKRKPSAAVLLTPTFDKAGKDDAETGILLEHNVGFGRVLFVGLDSTWRWRFRVGDTYHHRFWGQLARWSAADKLLPAGNRFVRYGSREPVYAQSQEVDLAVRFSETLPPLKDAADARIKVLRPTKDGGEDVVAVIPLKAHPRQPNVMEAKVRELPAGLYRVELDIPQYRVEIAEPPDEKEASAKGRDQFRVLPKEQPELLDLSTNWILMQTLAERSGGHVYTPEDVEGVLRRLARRIERSETRSEQKPWQDEPMVWWMLGILIGLLTLEWGWRRWLELA